MPGPLQRIDEHLAAYAADTAVIAHARNEFAAWLSRVTLDDQAVSDLTVVLSELLANAVHAAGETREALVHVLAEVEGAEVVLEVRNTCGRRGVERDRWNLDDPLRGGGRGFVIVESLVDDLTVEHDDGTGTTVVRSRTDLALHG